MKITASNCSGTVFVGMWSELSVLAMILGYNISQNETTLDLFPIPSQGRVLLWAVRPEGAD